MFFLITIVPFTMTQIRRPEIHHNTNVPFELCFPSLQVGKKNMPKRRQNYVLLYFFKIADNILFYKEAVKGYSSKNAEK